MNDLDPRSRDLIVRTVLGEAANEPDVGQAAVASVILNRARNGEFGKSIPEVILSRGQFEPWATPEGRRRMFSYAPDSEPYKRASAAVDYALAGNDPTNGATHFFSPSAQSALGRPPPAWASGEPTVIGRHNFYGGAREVNDADVLARFRQSQMKPVDDQDVLKRFQQSQQPSFAQRYSTEIATPADAPKLQEALEARAQQITRGQQQSPGTQMATEFNNVLDAATQGTNPNIDRYRGRLVSDQVFENDAGEITYRDPQTGQERPTDSKTQIAMRDPVDGKIKIFARGEDTNESGAVGVARVLAPGLNAGAATARPAIAAAKVTPRASEVFATAKPYYRAFEEAAGKIEVPAETGAGIADRVRLALDKKGLPPELAGAPVGAALRMLEGDGTRTIADLQQVKRVAGRGFESGEKSVRDAAAVTTGEIDKVIREVSPEAAANLKTADQIHSTAIAMQDLQRKASIADLRAGRAGYGGNAVNSMRQVLSPIVQRAVEGKKTPFQPDEIAAMREIVEGTPATNLLRNVGALSPSKGVLPIMAGGATMGIASALGASANKLAAVMTSKQIDRLNELVAKRSPAYSEAVAKATERYAKAQEAAAADPSPNRIGALVSAARLLASGLQRDGIQITSGQLLRQVAGQQPTAAEEQ